jgi:glycerol uptake operon antiterminator
MTAPQKQLGDKGLKGRDRHREEEDGGGDRGAEGVVQQQARAHREVRQPCVVPELVCDAGVRELTCSSERRRPETNVASHLEAGPAEIVKRLLEFPCGAAVKSEEQLQAALDARARVVFILRGNGLEIAPVVRRVHAAGKLAAVHLDLVDGVASDITGVRWLCRSGADAIISSQAQAVRAVKAEGVTAIQRILCLSELTVELGLAAVARAHPDIVELLPGVILPEVADLVLPRLNVPLLAGGFVREEGDLSAILRAGALAVTSSEPSLWR